MSSILPGFEYDVFISYRQNDNKYDQWVTEFVANLNKELEATSKHKITVYFDSNPHDGLLDTHQVQNSLEEKLKCLVLIPILSRTYCDQKSFAWQQEFLAFKNIASQDQFGLNIKLSNGNIGSRILPVRIHDLDPEDVKLVEDQIGFIRSVDFIYHSPGVNRSLRPWDDDVIKNTKQPFYRDQINKVANAIDALIRGMMQAPPGVNIPAPAPVEQKPLAAKRRKVVWPVARFKRPAIAMVLFLLLGSSAWIGYDRYRDAANARHAREVLLPEINRLIEESSLIPEEAFHLAMQARKFIPEDSALAKLFKRVSFPLTLHTIPAGATVSWQDFNKPEGEWLVAGVTPLNRVSVPALYGRVKIEKANYQTLINGGFQLHFSGSDTIMLKLDSVGTVPSGMTHIPERTSRMLLVGVEQHNGKRVPEFFMDTYEVTNSEYKKFVESGGYANKAFWKHKIYSGGNEIAWDEAVSTFLDQTGKTGPSTWVAGTFPDGQAEFPVAGVSWYEASAYAEYAGKKLPTVFHWTVAAATFRAHNIIPQSNFSGKGTMQVGANPGLHTFGIYDMAGNVREWCVNESSVRNQHFILGGGWNDASYSFNDAYTQDGLDRSQGNGFRCIKLNSADTTYNALSGKLEMAFRDYTKERPVSDKAFDFYKSLYSYDKAPLNEQVIHLADSGIWRVEKVEIDAAYNSERLTVYMFIPRNIQPPYLPVILFPGSGSIFQKELTYQNNELRFLDFILKSGRALIFPVYKSTFQREDALKSDLPAPTVFYRDHVIMWRKDLGRAIDYLETRKDILSDKIGYLGYSWGAHLGGILPAVEPRIKAAVLHVGGMCMDKTLPEVDQINFLPRVKIPVLMLNGKYDMFFPVNTSQQPMFNFLGTPPKDKKLIIYESGHLVPKLDFIKESLAWYDQYLGIPLKRQVN